MFNDTACQIAELWCFQMFPHFNMQLCRAKWGKKGEGGIHKTSWPSVFSSPEWTCSTWKILLFCLSLLNLSCLSNFTKVPLFGSKLVCFCIEACVHLAGHSLHAERGYGGPLVLTCGQVPHPLQFLNRTLCCRWSTETWGGCIVSCKNVKKKKRKICRRRDDLLQKQKHFTLTFTQSTSERGRNWKWVTVSQVSKKPKRKTDKRNSGLMLQKQMNAGKKGGARRQI